MDLVSQTPDQKATAKRLKIHRASPEISRKIVAFEVIVNANSINSAREITKLLNIPNSTMQTWIKQKNSKNAEEIALFFSTPAGSALLQRLALAIIYNNKCGSGGIRGAQECLRNSGLDKYIASSKGLGEEVELPAIILAAQVRTLRIEWLRKKCNRKCMFRLRESRKDLALT